MPLALLANGVATVIAAGNSGYEAAVWRPSCISTAFAVGSTTDADSVSSFSNRGNLLDVFAPDDGVDSSVSNNAYANKSGTSMASPYVAGALALLRQVYPTSSISSLMSHLKNTGRGINYSFGGNVTTTRGLIWSLLWETTTALTPVQAP